MNERKSLTHTQFQILKVKPLWSTDKHTNNNNTGKFLFIHTQIFTHTPKHQYQRWHQW